jgi:DNA-binding MarR family transcriptional regulator
MEEPMIVDKQIKTLQDFGLSFLQAKTYLILVQLGEADAKTIARASNVARQEIYRVMPSLQKLGLGEKIIGKPVIYKATPLEDALLILIQKQKEAFTELDNKRCWLLQNFFMDGTKAAIDDNDTQFIITSELSLFFNTQRKLLQKTQESIDIMLPFIFYPDRFCQMWTQLKNTLLVKKTLKIRLLSQKGGELSKLPRAILDYPNFQFRYSTSRIPFGMHIFDKNELTMCISEKNGLPSLWSNNINVAILARNYFDLQWAKAELNPKGLNQPTQS